MVSAAVRDVDSIIHQSIVRRPSDTSPTDMTLTSNLDGADVLHESEALLHHSNGEEIEEEGGAEDIPCKEAEECPWEGEEHLRRRWAGRGSGIKASSSSSRGCAAHANDNWDQHFSGRSCTLLRLQ
eukprot:1735436-Amphidinium_carterae.2